MIFMSRAHFDEKFKTGCLTLLVSWIHPGIQREKVNFRHRNSAAVGGSRVAGNSSSSGVRRRRAQDPASARSPRAAIQKKTKNSRQQFYFNCLCAQVILPIIISLQKRWLQLEARVAFIALPARGAVEIKCVCAHREKRARTARVIHHLVAAAPWLNTAASDLQA